jgi:HEPN domain-containing protein
MAALCPQSRVMENNERNYIIWQNRAFRFYLGARLLLVNEQHSPVAFCCTQALESLMKATLVYWDKSFKPEEAGHKMKTMINTIRNKARDAKGFECPEYFYLEKRYQSVSRYPTSGKGLGIPASLLDDLDTVFWKLVQLVPFQFNSELKKALSGKNKRKLTILRRKNLQMNNLRKYLHVKLQKT